MDARHGTATPLTPKEVRCKEAASGGARFLPAFLNWPAARTPEQHGTARRASPPPGSQRPAAPRLPSAQPAPPRRPGNLA